ncbi:hypothetical protein GCM10018772_23670 [Streptomyces fumanus]|uniref:Transposase n=1 Tax=Streptomyces fumanus TaxID=67302 RepID=A0A919E0N2_9ACTN|nr:hypothetical protein GCM10018772_23670 [Streptomyces fumanus]
MSACRTPRGGRPDKHPRREIVDALFYVLDSGCKWRALPADFPPFQTVYAFFARWSAAGIWEKVRDHLRRHVRRALHRPPHAVAAIVDSQSVKGADTVGRHSRGYNPAKRINGRTRHIAVDLRGLPLSVMVTPADVSDRDAGREVLVRLRAQHPQITIVWTGSAYAGTLVSWAKSALHLTVETVHRPRDAVGFVLLPRRWIVERSLTWIMHSRRLVRDYERLPRHPEAMITRSAIRLMLHRLTRRSPHPPGRPSAAGRGTATGLSNCRSNHTRPSLRRPGRHLCPDRPSGRHEGRRAALIRAGLTHVHRHVRPGRHHDSAHRAQGRTRHAFRYLRCRWIGEEPIQRHRWCTRGRLVRDYEYLARHAEAAGHQSVCVGEVLEDSIKSGQEFCRSRHLRPELSHSVGDRFGVGSGSRTEADGEAGGAQDAEPYEPRAAAAGEVGLTRGVKLLHQVPFRHCCWPDGPGLIR